MNIISKLVILCDQFSKIVTTVKIHEILNYMNY